MLKNEALEARRLETVTVMEGRERESDGGPGADSDGTARHGRSVSLSAAHYFARQVPTPAGGASSRR